MTARRVLLVNPYDPLPFEAERVGRYRSLAGMLRAAGHDVTWLTASWAHSAKRARPAGPWTGEGLLVHVLPVRPYRSNVSLTRIWSHLEFAVRARAWLARHAPPDVAILSLPPLGSCLALAGWLERRGTRVIVDIQDLWPEALAALLPGPARAVLAPLRRLRDRMLRRASAVTAVSADYLAATGLGATGSDPAGLGATGLVCHLGLDAEALGVGGSPAPSPAGLGEPSARPPGGPAAPLRAAFAGSLSRSYDLGTVMAAATLARERGVGLHFTIMGDGPLLGELRKTVRCRGLDNVTLTGRVPYAEVGRILRGSHVGLNAVAPGSRCAFPNKVFDYLAAGLFVVNSIGGGELESLLADNGAGAGYTAGDAEALLVALERAAAAQNTGAAGRIARLGARFDRRVEYQPLLALVDRLAADDAGRHPNRRHLGWQVADDNRARADD